MIDRPHDATHGDDDDDALVDRLASAIAGVTSMDEVHDRIRENVHAHLPGATIEGLDEIYARAKNEIERRQNALVFSYDILDMVEVEREARGLVNDAFAPGPGETTKTAPSKALTMVAHLLKGQPHVLLVLTVDPDGHGHVQIGTNCDKRTVANTIDVLQAHLAQTELDAIEVDYEKRAKRAKRAKWRNSSNGH